MEEAVYWLKFAVALPLIGWMIYWSVFQARRAREAVRNSWWPLASDEPTWPLVVMGWFGLAFALFVLGLLLYAAIRGIR